MRIDSVEFLCSSVETCCETSTPKVCDQVDCALTSTCTSAVPWATTGRPSEPLRRVPVVSPRVSALLMFQFMLTVRLFDSELPSEYCTSAPRRPPEVQPRLATSGG